MNLLKKCVPNIRILQQIKRAGALIACSLLFGCSTLISHSQSGNEPELHAKRSLGTSIDDNAIAGKIEAKIRKLNEQFAAMVQVDSYNKIILLTGRVPDKGFIERAVAIAARMPGVRQVHSEITHGEATTISNYWYDTWLTAKVKSQLTLTSNAPASKTKVRSFAGYVYLMGVMTPQEAKNAIYVTSRIPGAKKVISMIETIDPEGEVIVTHTPELQKPTTPTSSSFEPISDGSFDNENSNYIPPIELENNQLENSQANGFYNEYQTDYQPPSTANPQQVQSY